MTSPDVSLIERLRKENVDQFFTLVRMHLSFVVDINTDDVDCSTDKPKQFRWNFHKKTKNTTSNSSQNNGNNTKNTETTSITEEGILRLNELIDFLMKPENVTQEGIFRRTGSLSRQQELKQLLFTGSNLGLDDGKFSVHDCASVLKGFLAELPQPLLMDQYYQTYCTLAAQYPPNSESSETKLLTALQLLLLLLSPSHRNFLERLLSLLRLVADNETSNRMSPDTLATMFTPHLLCPRKPIPTTCKFHPTAPCSRTYHKMTYKKNVTSRRKVRFPCCRHESVDFNCMLSPETFHADALALSPLLSFMIRAARRVFLPPRPLATDAAAYLQARAARALSPDCALDESITDKSAARTVYTFVDRGRSRRENAHNPTDAALAQLYAHIHALPDSQHKRRLIKTFNRQNAYGTPIQIQRTGKVAGSRSLGDSIKRHIFNKGLLNKTPKKGSGSSINTIDEKTKTKLRYNDDTKVDVSHKNIVLKNLANKMLDNDLEQDENEGYASDESTLSEGALSAVRKLSPKFVSEPNLSIIDDETPKNTKKSSRLFRSKILSASNVNKKYQKRGAIRGTPKTCVSCFEEQDTGSDHDVSNDHTPLEITPQKSGQQYSTSTPGPAGAAAGAPGVAAGLEGLVGTPVEPPSPYTQHFRRASMSPITKSTQKLSKAMQESIMTPRSRKPLVIKYEQRDASPPRPPSGTTTNTTTTTTSSSSTTSTTATTSTTKAIGITSATSLADEDNDKSDLYRSLSPKNDSDFVSSDDDNNMSRSSFSCERSNFSRTSQQRNKADGRSLSAADLSPLRSETTRFVLAHSRPDLHADLRPDLNTTLCGEDLLVPNFKISHETSDYFERKTKALSEPFREYLLSRSVLTATPVDLSILNKSNDTDDKITDSLLYCLDGNVPTDLTTSISNLVVDSRVRSPLKNLNGLANQLELDLSPNRKRTSSNSKEDKLVLKKAMVEKENFTESYDIRETEL